MIMDIKMQNILALENIVAFTEVSSRLYKDWVRWYHEIVIKLYKIESQGFNQAVKKYKKHDEELNITIITEAPPFPEYVDIYIYGKGICTSQFLVQVWTFMKGMKQISTSTQQMDFL